MHKKKTIISDIEKLSDEKILVPSRASLLEKKLSMSLGYFYSHYVAQTCIKAIGLIHDSFLSASGI